DGPAHLEMLDGIQSELLAAKWHTALRAKFHALLLKFSVYFVLTFVVSVLVVTPKAKLLGELAVVGGAVHYCCDYLLVPATILGTKLIGNTLTREPAFAMFNLSCVLIILCVPIRVLGLIQLERAITLLVLTLMPAKMWLLCRGFKSVGPFVVMVHKMIASDILCFVIIYAIFVIGFAQSFYIIFTTHTNVEHNYFLTFTDSMVSMFLMALNEFGEIFDQFAHTDYPLLAKALFVLYMILVSVLLINMLIAMMGKTYQDIASQTNENLRQWARIVLLIELLLSNRERRKLLSGYSKQVSETTTSSQTTQGSNSRVFCTSWPLDSNDRRDIDTFSNSSDE
ncbi:Transient receptor potential cation channel subfamily V member 6, partial [Fragariocoptes setiger]